MKKRVVCYNGPLVSEIGLGCMGMSGLYGITDRSECIATIHAALEKGITLIDLGDLYADGHNELLIREALKGIRRDNVFIAVKFDGNLHPLHSSTVEPVKRPQTIKNFLKDSLQRLGDAVVVTQAKIDRQECTAFIFCRLLSYAAQQLIHSIVNSLCLNQCSFCNRTKQTQRLSRQRD